MAQLSHSPQPPLSVSDIALFVAYLSPKKLTPSTISTYISALSCVHKIAFVVQKIKTAQRTLCSSLRAGSLVWVLFLAR